MNVTNRKRHRSSAQIRELLGRYRRSQLSQAEFVQNEGICVATLNNYIRRESGGRSTLAVGGFVEVERADAAPDAGGRHSYRVCFEGGVAVEIPPGFSSVEVARLLEVISAMGAR